MRRLYPWVAAILCGLLLVGCSAPEPLTTEELHQQFQAAFDAGGGGIDSTEAQVEDELEILRAAAEETKGFPEGYEEDYRTWRKETVAALEAAEEAARQAAAKALRGEYEALIAERPRYNGLNAGLFYAGYWDFNGDGTEELLLLSLSEGPIRARNQYPSTLTWEIFGQVDGTVRLCGEDAMTFDLSEYKITLLKSGDKIYLSPYEYEFASLFLPEFLCYGFDGQTVALCEQVSGRQEWLPDAMGKKTVYYSEYTLGAAGNELTEEEYQALMGKYTPVEEPFSLSWDYGDSLSQARELTYERGVLPEPEVSSDERRRIALLDELDEETDLVYAKVIDLNQDGMEDLVTLKQTQDGLLFISHLWEKDQVRKVEINEGSIQGVTRYAYTYALCQERNTGQIYYYYVTEGSSSENEYYVNAVSPSEQLHLCYPSRYNGTDSSAQEKPPEVYAAEVEEYQAQQGRFTCLECAYGNGNHENGLSMPENTVETARQQLLQP